MEGYYDNVIFHRLVPGFILQGGDPTGTGEGGESIFGQPFKDEFHSRLRYTRRGLVGMANTGPHTNGSQFFITLGNTPELTDQNTLFGKVVGDTIYNVIKANDFMVGNDDRPTHPPVITSVEILHNPFDDIIPRSKKAAQADEKTKKKKKRTIPKDNKLLSFADDSDGPPVPVGIQSYGRTVTGVARDDSNWSTISASGEAGKRSLKDKVRKIIAGENERGTEGGGSEPEESRKRKREAEDERDGREEKVRRTEN
eukprot:CAMPEP_0119154644 /NCGR_PEP_ID=MMETSP1310-20130426/51083_1 /TAXON_ID=464262 /ORGANISM="Genus nov. species nov., Strain RCC2339" /LENGTH=254 /DNA_ID=CAMNT_0007147183 /DNA_START=93 /DNA_END=854 /DNA_ORIENTATION=+